MNKKLTRSLLIIGALSLSVPAFAEGEPQGAQSLAGALDRDHDGSILDNVGSFRVDEGGEDGEAEARDDEREEEGDDDGQIQGRAHNPNATSGGASQPERNEGNEDELDINDWDDGNGNGGASQGNGG